VARGATYQGVGVNEQIDNAAFALKKGEVSQPVSTDTAVVVVQAKDRQEMVPAGLDAARESLREELTNARASTFFEAYMAKARAKMTIAYNDAAIQRVIQ